MRPATTAAAIAALAAALALSACSPGAPAADSASTAAPAPDASAPAAPAASSTTPAMEGPAAGKWKSTITTMGQTVSAPEVCYTKQTSFAEAEKMQQQAGIACSEQSYRREGDAVIGRSVCSVDMAGKPVKMTTDTRVTGDFSSKYTMEITSRMDPPPMAGMDEQKMSITAERIGDC